jgi:hypothetical protein
MRKTNNSGTAAPAAKAARAVKAAAVPARKTAAAKPAINAKDLAGAKKPAAAVKPVVKPDAVPASKAAKEKAPATPNREQKEKNKKPKLVRDSFTMPEAEYAVLGDVKKACLKAGIEVKKSELLRVGVALLKQIELIRLKEILAGLPALKAGRPKKNK